MMFRVALAAVAVAFGVSAVIAQQNPVAARKALMKEIGQVGYGEFNRMVRDQMPYDQAKVTQGFAKMADAASKLAPLYPASAKGEPVADSNFYASAKIWENKSDFEAKLAKLIKDIGDNKDKVKDLASLKDIWPTISKNSCDGCHEVYRVRKG
jgi:cytochrome c556